MKNELFTVGPFTVYGYGLMIALGIVAGYFVMEYRARKQKLAYEHIFYIVVWCLLGGFLVSKILYWITEWRTIVRDPMFMLQTIFDGFVVYGGILGGILAGWCYCKKKHLEFLRYFDLAVPSLALAQSFGRIGCFLAGCCYGKETTGPISIVFKESDFAPNHVHLVPTQLYSGALDFLLFLFLLKVSKHKKSDGQTAGFYLLFYSVGRFILEFFRGDAERGMVGIFSTSQFISLFTGAAGMIILLLTFQKESLASGVQGTKQGKKE